MQTSFIPGSLLLFATLCSCAAPGTALQQSNEIVANERASEPRTQLNSDWTKTRLPLSKPGEVITFGSGGRVAIGGEGIIIVSSDGGKSWSALRSGKGSYLSTTDGGKTFRSEDNGIDASMIEIDKLCSVESAVFASSGRLYLNTRCDHSSALLSVPLVSTSDPWHILVFAPSAEQYEKDEDYFSPGRNLVAAGGRILADAILPDGISLLTTENEGAAWSTFWRDPHSKPIVNLDFLDGQQGFMLQGDGKLLRTEDGGRSWHQVSILPREAVGRVFSFDFVNTRTGFVVGEEGRILASKDGGRSWRQQFSQTNRSLYRVAAANEKKAWAVGERGIILKTNDGGETWRKVDLNVNEDIRALTVHDEAAWLIIGTDLYRLS